MNHLFSTVTNRCQFCGKNADDDLIAPTNCEERELDLDQQQDEAYAGGADLTGGCMGDD